MITVLFLFLAWQFYIDGVEVTEPGSKSNLTSLSIKKVERTSNFIGRSNYPNDKDADADIDESEYEKAIDEIDKIEHHFKMNINIYTQQHIIYTY